MNNEFVEYCKTEHWFAGFTKRIPDELYDSFEEAVKYNLADICFTPYGEMFIVKD